MKTAILTTLTMLMMGTLISAQTLKEKLKAKKVALEAKLNANLSAGSLDPNISQVELASKWTDGTYKLYRFNGSACLEDGKTILKFKKDGDKVVSVVKDDGGEYRADKEGISKFVRYYKSEGEWNIVFTENWAYIFTYTHEETQVKGKYFIKKSGKYADAEMIKQYLEDSKTNQAEELAIYEKNQAAEANKVAAEKKAKWSIEGKAVTNIEITDIKAPHKFGYFRGFSFQVKSTLKDGKTISTKDGGFWSDYKTSFKNGDYKSGSIQPTSFVKDDKIILTVTSKFDPSVKVTKEIVLNYDEDLHFTNNAKNWGTSANDYKIEIKQVKHASNGSDLLLYRVTDLDGYDPVKVFKLRADQTFHFNTDGANGMKVDGLGNQTGSGQNAGDAGNITVVKDPNVKKYNLNYSMKGGTGGAGTYGYNRGRDGRDGIFKEETRTIKF